MTTSWNLEQARRDAAAEFAGQVVRNLGIVTPPVSPFRIIQSERRRILAFGDDFGDAFDGRLEYQHPRFLLFFNTKYDSWSHRGEHHPKVNFTVAHELGHFFLNAHRRYLRRGGQPHGSQTEFVSDNLSEREADAFATGLLMPRFLANKVVNAGLPTLAMVQEGRELFDVSLTSMMVRWVELSDFPCAMCCVREGRIEWGFTSSAFKRAGAWRVKRGVKAASRAASTFLAADTSLSRYREGQAWGKADAWLDFESGDLGVTEYFVAIPSTRQMLVLIAADEDDVVSDDDS